MLRSDDFAVCSICATNWLKRSLSVVAAVVSALEAANSSKRFSSSAYSKQKRSKHEEKTLPHM
jgi:hypothetical protein